MDPRTCCERAVDEVRAQCAVRAPDPHAVQHEAAFREREARSQRESERLLALHRASTVLAAQTAEPDAVLEEVLRSAVALLGASSASLYRWDGQAEILRCVRNWQVPASDVTPDVSSGVGLAGQVFARGETLVVNDYPAWELAMASGRDGGLCAGLGVPLRHGGRTIGVLLIRSYCPDGPPFTDDDARLVALFGDQAAIAMENARMLEREQQRRRQLEAIRDVTADLTRELDLTALLELIWRRAAQLVGATAGAVHLWDEGGQVLVPRAWHGFKPWITTLRLRLGEAVAGTVAQRRAGMFVNDFRTSSHALPAILEHTETTAVLAAPILYQERLIGVITANREGSGEPFAEQDLELLRLFADQAAIAIENAGEVTERRRVEERLRVSEERYRGIVETAQEGIWMVDAEGLTTFVNAETAAMLGYAIEEMVGAPLYGFMDEEGRALATAAAARRRRAPLRKHDFRFRRKDGSVVWAIASTNPLFDNQGCFVGELGMLTDITDRKRQEEALRHSAFHDALTGLPNRALFADRLEQALARGKRHAGYRLAVLLVDLDRFKEVNDSHGHLAGDQVLIAVARRLEAVLRAGDSVARLGGDEFAILLDDIKDPTDATDVAARVQQQLALPLDRQSGDGGTTASIGIAVSSVEHERAEDLLRDADTALYRAKALGRNRSTVFDTAMRARRVALRDLEAELREAPARGELRLHYQPIMSLQTGALVRVEALVRWQHPVRGLLPPAEFLPVAEASGLIVPIGAWVLGAACAQAQAWAQAGLPTAVAVNVSARQFERGDLGAVVAQTLAATGLAAEWLELELTESAVMEDVGRAIATLAGLKAQGVKLAVDDFGTGYSSLSYLTRLPVDALKIDQSFVRELMTDRTSELVTKAVVDLAHNLDLRVTAEGADTPGHVAYLRSLGCDEVQGYLIGYPASADELLPLLRRGRRLWPRTTVAKLVLAASANR